MNVKLLVCALTEHRVPDQRGQAFQTEFAVTTTTVAPHDIENTSTTRPALCCLRCDHVFAP